MQLVSFLTHLVMLLMLAGLVSCKESQEDERSALELEKERIVLYAKSGQCINDSQCRFVGLGSKPCGGPRMYLLYSASLDTTKLLTMISQYNAGEHSFNLKWGLGSDCSIPAAPDSVRCVEGVCVGYWNGVAR